MTSTKPHAFPGYDKIAADLEHAARIYKHYSAAYCWTLLETAETYAQQAQLLQQRNEAIEPLLVEIVARLRMPMMLGKVERQRMIERIERTLSHDQNDESATSRPEAAE